MRKFVVAVIAVLVVLGMLAPQSFAQGPAPKVTINGLVDFVTVAYMNHAHTTNQAGQSPQTPDATLGNKETGWWTRERGVFTITGEVGKVKGVWAVELDFTNGAGNFNQANNGSQGTVGVAANGTSANFDLDTDIQGAVETKWLYLEAPITGPGSLLPFIPVPTIGRFGAMPFTGHDYKVGVLATGDFPGINLETRWAPNVKSTLTFVQIAEALDRFIAPNQKDSWALITSIEFDAFKGLTIKPTYAYAEYHGGNCGSNNLGTEGVGGYNPNANCPGVVAGTVAGPGLPGNRITRHYFGGDLRLVMGPFSFQPTLLVLMGTEEIPRRGGGGAKNDVEIRSFLLDTIAGFRAGPFLIEGRLAYTPGMEANQDVQNAGGGVDRTYHPINSGFNYMSGWSEIWKSGIDYASGLFVQRGGVTMRQSPSYDKYGRIFAALAADYSLTPALTFHLITNFSWTDRAVDTKATWTTAGGIQPSGITTPGNPFTGGKERYLGNEWVAGLTYRFAPNVVFDLAAATLITGDALNIQRSPAAFSCVTNGIPTCEAQNVYKLAGRIRVTF